ncbi:MAG: sigma 54-interacting transcriptional regulator [Planctomycetes bacterium]|nr:sigma 54-interacting transcriptional regulator [Planctomycetota bacterium]
MSIQDEAPAFRRLVGRSAALARIRETARTAAAFPSTVLIHGESGTGKELVARAIHEFSPRASGPFVTVDCTVLTETLFESLLFGHEKGAFSGAIASTQGLIRAAEGGTVFLDELGELPAPEQAKMLRLLQERTVTPVGATRPIPVNVRVVAATHRDLHAMTVEGRFRRDLLYRLDVIRITTPPLRECAEDIPLIANAILDDLVATLGVQRSFSAGALDAMLLCAWPGNVRQLATCIERAAVLCPGTMIEAEHLGLDPREPGLGDRSLLDRSTAEAVKFALSVSGGNRSAAARRLGIDRRQLYRMMDRLCLREPVQRTL